MTTTFNVGDRVRLTGKDWADCGGDWLGAEVTIDRVDADGDLVFLDSDGNEWYIYNAPWFGDYSAELVEAAPGTTPRLLEAIATLVEELGIDPSPEFAETVDEPTPPPVSEYRDPHYEEQIRTNEDLQSVIRKDALDLYYKSGEMS